MPSSQTRETCILESLRPLLEKTAGEELLTAKPLGWNNIERFSETRPAAWRVRRVVSRQFMNQFAVLPPAAQKLFPRAAPFSRSDREKCRSRETHHENRCVRRDDLDFFTGIRHGASTMNVGKAAMNRKVDNFMKVVRQL